MGFLCFDASSGLPYTPPYGWREWAMAQGLRPGAQ